MVLPLALPHDVCCLLRFHKVLPQALPTCSSLILPLPVTPGLQGAAANFVESEQLVALDGGQVRASCMPTAVQLHASCVLGCVPAAYQAVCREPAAAACQLLFKGAATGVLQKHAVSLGPLRLCHTRCLPVGDTRQLQPQTTHTCNAVALCIAAPPPGAGQLCAAARQHPAAVDAAAQHQVQAAHQDSGRREQQRGL